MTREEELMMNKLESSKGSEREFYEYNLRKKLELYDGKLKKKGKYYFIENILEKPIKAKSLIEIAVIIRDLVEWTEQELNRLGITFSINSEGFSEQLLMNVKNDKLKEISKKTRKQMTKEERQEFGCVICEIRRYLRGRNYVIEKEDNLVSDIAISFELPSLWFSVFMGEIISGSDVDKYLKKTKNCLGISLYDTIDALEKTA